MAEYPIAINTARSQRAALRIAAGIFRSDARPAAQVFLLLLRRSGHVRSQQAEERALAETAQHAALADGQRILELGCGWGSLSLWMARKYPAARIVVGIQFAFATRVHQRKRAEAKGCATSPCVAADINAFAPAGPVRSRRFGRDVRAHVELARAAEAGSSSWLTPQGALFVHIFSHRRAPYRFDAGDRADWIAQHFFTGGIMPSHGLIRQFGDLVAVEEEWWWDGNHYRRTAEHWLENFDRNAVEVDARAAGRSTATTPRSGIAAGVCSCTRPLACSATAAARNGASATIGSGRRADRPERKSLAGRSTDPGGYHRERRASPPRPPPPSRSRRTRDRAT